MPGPRRHFVLASTLVFLLCQTSFGQNRTNWQWSPRADHHKAAVQVEVSGAGCSGAYVEHNGKQGVLTCWHVFRGYRPGSVVKITFSNGTTKNGIYRAGLQGPDIAWVEISSRSIRPLKIAVRSPQPGTQVEFVTYGGYLRGTLRHWFARLTRVGTDARYSSYVISGDSGGVILNSKREVIGVQSYGENTVDTLIASGHAPWPVYDNPGGATHKQITQFCDQVCGQQYQRPQIQPPNTYPPQNDRPGTSPDQQYELEIDYALLAKEVVKEMEKNPEPFRGQPGKNGVDGKDGSAGVTPVVDYDQLASQVEKRLPPIKVMKMGANNEVDSVDEVRLGEELRLPPIRMQIRHLDGKIKEQVKPLGGVISLKLVPAK